MSSFDADDLRTIGTPIDGNVPPGDPSRAWPNRKLDYKLVSPLNRRKFTVIVVGTGLAGAACAASLGELDRKSTRQNSSHNTLSRMPSSA